MKLIGKERAAFIKFEIENGDSSRAKKALQELSFLYRKGHALSGSDLHSFQIAINGIILKQGQDIKVVRWGLNALARFGSICVCGDYVNAALRKFEGIPEIQASGVACLVKMHRGITDRIGILNNIEPKIWKLAALQVTEPKYLDFEGLRINIDNEGIDVLKLALITVGLNRCFENLFDPKYRNGEIVRHLCLHDDVIVQQYSVWAIIENKSLSIDHLGIDVEKIDDLAENVQAKAYQLIAESDPDLHRRLRITSDCSVYGGAEAREGLARGVLSNYYDGLQDITISWFDQESNHSVREILAQHFAKNAFHCPVYWSKSEEIYDQFEEFRKIILVGSEGTNLYSTLKGKQTADLFTDYTPRGDLVSTLSQSSLLEGKMTKKVLFMAVSPLNEEPLRLDQEYRDVKDHINRLNNKAVNIEIIYETAVRLDDIQTHLLNSNPDILHFSGHGDQGALIFEKLDGTAGVVRGDIIAEYIKMLPSIRCVVLNACYSETIVESIASNIDAVIGCEGPIADEASVVFSKSFYQALSSGRSYEDSFNFGVIGVRNQVTDEEALKYKLVSGNTGFPRLG